MATRRWTTRTAKAKPRPKPKPKRYKVVTLESARTWADGSKSPKRRTVSRGRGGILAGMFTDIFGEKRGKQHRSRPWW
jgi:hypothetical protein